MPIVEITMIEGRSFAAKEAMVEKVTVALMETISAPRDAVRVIIREVPPWHFAHPGRVGSGDVLQFGVCRQQCLTPAGGAVVSVGPVCCSIFLSMGWAPGPVRL